MVGTIDIRQDRSLDRGLAPLRRAPTTCERASWERSFSTKSDQVGDRRGDVTQAHGAGDDPSLRYAPGEADQQWDVQLRPVEADPMPSKPVLAEGLAVVGRDDDERIIQHPTSLEFGKQLAELTVKVRKAVVVLIPGQRQSAARRALA